MRLDAATGRAVEVEVYLLRAEAGRLAYRRCAGALGAREDPDAAARRLAGVPGGAALVHSTSWRCEDDGRVVLTYAVLPDPERGRPALAVGDVGLAYGESADRPSPVRVEFAQVALHAARHLAFLVEHDPHVGDVVGRDAGLAAVLASCAPGLAGRA
ncbi:hypothetical protein ACFVH6_22350 [Spirillospora sp. NPDC127200]